MPSDLGIKFRDRIATRYPAIDKIDIPYDYAISSLDYRKEDIKKYHVIFWHRLLKNIYEKPLEIECAFQSSGHKQKAKIQSAFFRKTEEENNWEVKGVNETFALELKAGKIKPLPVNWKYLIKLPSGGIVELGTKDKNTIFYIAQVILPESSQKHVSEEAKKFVDLLMEEANRLNKVQLFNPTKEFEKQEGMKLYLLSNIYLSNYLSAKTMLQVAESQEADLREKFLRYDARTTDLLDEEKRTYIDQHMLTCGMFYCSSITYFFMALEGFVNLVFHAFLKKRFRNKDLRTDQRLDLEQKLRFMPSLCNGFNEDSELPLAVLEGFKMLKKYRNSLFHSKIEDSLMSLCFVEDGFLYNCEMDAYKDRFLPSHKIKLTTIEVVQVKSIVDKTINSIVESMNQDTRLVTMSYFLKEPHIPFTVLESGELQVGKTTLA